MANKETEMNGWFQSVLSAKMTPKQGDVTKGTVGRGGICWREVERADNLGLTSGSATHKLGDIGQVT